MREILRKSLRDGVFGIQDGLISTAGALTGIAAGTQSQKAAAIAGLVIVTVESLSMAAGSYLSSKSHRQLLEKLLREEEEAIKQDPENERREVWEMYRARGYQDEEIKIIEKRLFSDKRLLLEDMAHKELGICPQSMEEPAANAVVMGLAYIAGGLIPALPYWFFPIPTALPLSLGLTGGALLIFGAIKGRMVGTPPLRSGVEMLVIAGLAGAAGYFIGRLAGIVQF